MDFMHEFELGVWKNTFAYLIRVLYALPNGINLVATLDSRYFLLSNHPVLLLIVNQISAASHIWGRHYPSLFKQHL